MNDKLFKLMKAFALLKVLSKAKDTPINMTAEEAVKEHKHLVHVLETPSHKDDIQEAKKQKKELTEYKEKLSESEKLSKPYKSDAQRKWAHTSTGTKALGGKSAVAHWDKESKGKELPEHKEELEKAAPKPVRVGEISPDGTRIAQKHPNGLTVWYHSPHLQKKYDNGIKNQLPAFASKLPESHRETFVNFANNVLQSPTRHAIVGAESYNGMAIPRARHLYHLLNNSGHVKMDLAPDSIVVSAERHVDDPKTSFWKIPLGSNNPKLQYEVSSGASGVTIPKPSQTNINTSNTSASGAVGTDNKSKGRRVLIRSDEAEKSFFHESGRMVGLPPNVRFRRDFRKSGRSDASELDTQNNNKEEFLGTRLYKSEMKRYLEDLGYFEKARPARIQLETGANKGRNAEVIGEKVGTSGNEYFRILPVMGSKPFQAKDSEGNLHTAKENQVLHWDKNRKHKVLAEMPTPKTFTTPPTRSYTPEPSYHSRSYSVDPSSFKGVKINKSHAHPAIPHSAKQKDLIHGIDLGKVKQQDKGWTSDMTLSGFTKNPKGKNVIVKGHIPEDDLGSQYNHENEFGLSTSQREALYHNLAHNAFGLGKYVPTTGVADINGDHFSVMEVIPKAEPYNESNRKHKKIMDEARDKGDIQKLAIMNTILGNSDRHGGNYMLSPKGLHMIDHGLAFNYNDNGRDIFTPAYLDDAYSAADGRILLHPKAAKWLKELNLNDVKKELGKHQIHSNFKKSILGALQAAKTGVSSNYMHDLLNTIRDFHNENME